MSKDEMLDKVQRCVDEIVLSENFPKTSGRVIREKIISHLGQYLKLSQADKVELYKDDLITLYSNWSMEVQDFPMVMDSTMIALLIGAKTYSLLAKDPLKLWNICKRQLLKQIDEMEDIILSEDEKING